MWAIGQQATLIGDASAFDVLASEDREALRTLYSEQCIDGLAEAAAEIAPTVGELFSVELMQSFRCISFGTCPDDPWAERLDQFRATMDRDGPPFWFHLGSLDARSPFEPIVCDSVRPLRAEGYEVGACTYEEQHNFMALRPMGWVREWIAALSAGESAPTCDESLLPSCEAEMPDAGMGDAGGSDDAGMMDGGV
jgi:hypothetical protein